MLEHTFAKLPEPIREVRIRADGVFFDHKIIDFIAEKKAFYVIVARLTSPLKSRLPGLRYRGISSGCGRRSSDAARTGGAGRDVSW